MLLSIIEAYPAETVDSIAATRTNEYERKDQKTPSNMPFSDLTPYIQVSPYAVGAKLGVPGFWYGLRASNRYSISAISSSLSFRSE